MKNILKTTTAQFRKCQATIATFQCENEKHEQDYWKFTIFYSYTCPKIVEFPDGTTYKFTFDNSRKAWAITSSMTTSKQCNKWLGFNHHDLKPFNLWEFEHLYFDTRLEKYY